MTPNGMVTTEELVNSIHEFYGFNKALIKNPSQCGLWHARFEVNGIKYYGACSFNGALPTITVTGYTTENYYHDTPVEDWFYEEFIQGKQVKILKCIDAESGDWEDTGIRYINQEKAKEFISGLKNPEEYRYEIVT